MNLFPIRHRRLAAIFGISLAVLPLQLFADQVFPDPVGDLIGLDEEGPDAIALVATDLGNALRLDVELTEPDQAAGLTGLIEIETGQATDMHPEQDPGARSRLSLLCPKPTGLGVNLTIDLFNRDLSGVPVRDSADQIVGQALWEDTAQGFAITLSKQLIGYTTGALDLAVIIGNEDAASDCIPDAGSYTRAEVSLHRLMIEASASAGGSISPDGEIVADLHEPVSFDLLPDPGHEVDTVDSSCGGSLDGLTFTTDPISQECIVEAGFVEKTTTTLASDTGTPIFGEPVTFTVAVTGALSQPEGGSITIEADSGETCTSTEGTGTDNVMTFTCQIDFTETGPRSLVADYIGSDTHAASQSQPLTLNVVESERIFEDRFEQASD